MLELPPPPEVVRRHPVGLVGALVFVATFVTLLFLIRSGEEVPGPEVPVADEDLELVERDVARQLEPVSLRPLEHLRIRAQRIRWIDPGGGPVLTAPSAAVTISAAALRGGALVFSDGVLEQPELRLVRGAGGRWNFQRALDPMLGDNGPRDGARGGARVSLRDVVVRNGFVDFRLNGASYTASSVDIRLTSAELAGPDLPAPTFQLASLDARVELPDTAGGTITRDVALEDARITLPGGGVAFDVEAGRFGTSRFANASGTWDPAAGGLGLDATLTVLALRLADVPWLLGEVPEGAVGSARLRIEPVGDRTAVAATGLVLTAPGSSARGSLRALIGGGRRVVLENVDLQLEPLALALVETFTGPLPYAGELRGRVHGTGGAIRFDLQATLSTPELEPFRTDLAGQIAFADDGVRIERLTAELDRVPLAALAAIAPGLPLRGPVSGTVTLTGAPGEAPIRLDVRLEAGGGVVALAGTVDLTGAAPRYDLSGRLIGVELRQVLTVPAPPAHAHATFELEGVGTDPRTATASLALAGRFTGWRAEPGDTLLARVELQGGRLRAETVRVSLGPIEAVAAGDWSLVGGDGSIRYGLTVASLATLGPYLPSDPEGRTRFARGRIAASGTLSGTLEAPLVAGEVEAESFRFGEWAAASLAGEYDARLTEGLPYVQASFSGQDLRTPSGDFDAATLELNMTRPDFELALHADRADDGIIEVAASGRIEEARREITLGRMEVDLERQRWRLPEPTRVAWTAGEAIRVDDLRLEQVDGDGVLRLDGVVAPVEQAAFDIEIEALPVGEVLALVGSEMDLAGRLSLDAAVSGPADNPRIEGRFALTDGSFQGVAIRSVQATLDYQGAGVVIDGSGTLGDSARFEVRGRVPIRMGLAGVPTFQLAEDEPIDVRVTTDAFPLETLDPGAVSVRDVAGLMQADFAIAGTPNEPVLSGSARVTNGAATFTLLDQRYTDIQADLTFEGRQLGVRRLTARSDGTAEVTGAIRFDELTDPTLELTAQLEEFRAQGVENEEGAALWGTVRIGGTVAQPRVSGSIRVDNGAVSAMAFQRGPQFGDPLVGVAEPFELAQPGELEIGASDEGLIVDNLRIHADDDVWFVTEQARANLRGDLTLNRVGGELSILGELEGEQGVFNLRMGPVTRRFEIIEAHVRFFGGAVPDPGLDVLASRTMRVEEGTVEMRARISGTLSNPNLNLETAEGAAVPESELLSFLLFGQSTASLGDVPGLGGGGALLQDALTAFGLYDFASEQLLRELDVGWTPDLFQIQSRQDASPGQDIFQELYVVIGHELLDEVMVIAEVPIRGEEGWAITGEWRIDRQWTLEAGYRRVKVFGLVGAPESVLSTYTRNDKQLFTAIRRRWTY